MGKVHGKRISACDNAWYLARQVVEKRLDAGGGRVCTVGGEYPGGDAGSISALKDGRPSGGRCWSA